MSRDSGSCSLLFQTTLKVFEANWRFLEVLSGVNGRVFA